MKKYLLSLLVFISNCLVAVSLFGGTANAANHHRVHPRHIALSHTYHDGRPSAWCGWQMRQWNGGDTSFNLARNWSHRGVESLPKVGAIVVWSHHVAQIDGYDTKKKMWTVRQGNPFREHHPRSIAGAIAIRSI